MSEEHKKIASDFYDDAKDLTFSFGKLFETIMWIRYETKIIYEHKIYRHKIPDVESIITQDVR